MSKTRLFLKYWLLPLAWMSLIFLGSSDSHSYQHSSGIVEPILRWFFPHMTPAHIEALHHVIRKCAHLTEYAILGLILWRAVRKPVRNDLRPWSWRQALIAIGIVFLYASTDEVHQIFVPTRTPLFTDVLIDTTGSIIGMLLLWSIGRTFKWWPKPPVARVSQPASS